MKKLDKALNIIFIVVVCLLVVGLCVDFAFLNYRPEETKAFNDILIDYVNKPLPVIGVSLIVVGKLVFTLFARTSWGKSQIKAVNEKLEETKTSVEKEIKSLEEEKERLIQELEAYKTSLIGVLSQIPNKKVQDKLSELSKGKVEEVKNEERNEEREETING